MDKKKKERAELKRQVLAFIARFTDDGKRSEVIECFTSGCCYYFANALWLRFGNLIFDKDTKIEMMYDPIANHFGCQIGDNVYDVTGDVTKKYGWNSWIQYAQSDDLESARITRDCINF